MCQPTGGAKLPVMCTITRRMKCLLIQARFSATAQCIDRWLLVGITAYGCDFGSTVLDGIALTRIITHTYSKQQTIGKMYISLP